MLIGKNLFQLFCTDSKPSLTIYLPIDCVMTEHLQTTLVPTTIGLYRLLAFCKNLKIL